jgi:hypothetical protein
MASIPPFGENMVKYANEGYFYFWRKVSIN